ncbi:MAG: hypothetical protein RIT26_212 [Pseudomonadota bacterium]|jgi:hypothetical protein
MPSHFLISDAHIGTTMWQHALLTHLGLRVTSATLSKRGHYAPDGLLHPAPWVRHLSWWPRRLIGARLKSDPVLHDITHALCSFPPARCEALLRLPEHVQVWVNLGHRFHIHVRGWRLKAWTEQVRRLMQDPRMVWASMSHYDAQYTRFYTGMAPPHALPVASFHLPRALRERDTPPSNRTVLIGPSHHQGRVPGLPDPAELNRLSAAWARRLGVAAYRFQSIREAYPNGQATPERLSCHPAVVISPYSAFSISMIELYQLNLPMFVPVNGLLVDAMADVRLHPIYQGKRWVEGLEAEYAERARAMGMPYSPNSPEPDAQRHWIEQMFFNQVPHVQRFDQAKDLLNQLYAADLSEWQHRMRSFNAEFFKQAASTWQGLTQAPGPTA